MNKKTCIIINAFLLVWFFLDMTGLRIGRILLVENALKDDGIFFLIYLACFVVYIIKEKFGQFILAIWLSLWFYGQFMSHWYYTIFGVSGDKLSRYNNYFLDTYHIIPASDQILVPDLYHILLHIFIVAALVSIIIYIVKKIITKRV
ncbi:MAG: hypothetical protein K0S47_1295 [Herbinix sp.]|jgi:hypothetical protein|nr:hypothetical protein [Herbinix sp.]